LTRVALSIAGSDSSAGAGIQADLKTFSALGVYGCTAITAITAQNTMEISYIDPIPSHVIEKQISSILNDMKPQAIKIGMVYNIPTINAVKRVLESKNCPIVLDPVIYATNGSKLLEDNAFESFISTLVPISSIITPNIVEAQKICGVLIRSEKDMVMSAKKIRKLGAKSVIIKGGHLARNVITDYLLKEDGSGVKISKERVNTNNNTHGSGCGFSAALTAFLALGFGLEHAFKLANKHIDNSIRKVLRVGKGSVVADPVSLVYSDACRYDILHKTQHAVNEIETLKDIGILIPETQSNIVFALPGAKVIDDVAGVRGRIIRVGNMARPISFVQFGASLHIAHAIIAYNDFNSSIRSAMNIKFDRKIREICHSLFKVTYYERRNEPKNIKSKEGQTIQWGITSALIKKPDADIIYHRGDVGKEAMTLVFGSEPLEVINKLKIILREYQKN
jgi:hydroxymethylpyrimidine kinase/phosphomethylpyrimidine kinase